MRKEVGICMGRVDNRYKDVRSIVILRILYNDEQTRKTNLCPISVAKFTTSAVGE